MKAKELDEINNYNSGEYISSNEVATLVGCVEEVWQMK